ncbi:MAG: glutamate racemase [Candidatus Brocadia sp.]|nr:glutamate racemase [Candidatus Brocadia sp.]
MEHLKSESSIAVFDSGIGSISIIKELRRYLPCENYIYLADKKHFPYGQKKHDDLLHIIQNTIGYLTEQFCPKLIVIASNTPSIQVLHKIKTSDTKIFGVFPPVLEAVDCSKTGHIAILATRSTVESPELEEYIKSKKIPPTIKITKFNASPMVELVESGSFLLEKEKSRLIIERELKQLAEIDADIDTMTLSSTHLPFLKNYFSSLRPDVCFIDPAEIIAKKVMVYLRENNIEKKGAGYFRIIVSQDKKLFESIIKKLGIDEEVAEVNFNF